MSGGTPREARAAARAIRAGLANTFERRAAGFGWKPTSATYRKQALEFIAGAATALHLVGRTDVINDMMLTVLMVREPKELFDAWVEQGKLKIF